MKKYFFIFIVLTYILITSFKNASAQENKVDEYCVNTIKNMSGYWIKDSLGTNGFRLLLSVTSYFKRCSLKGDEWKKWEIYFGQPSRKIKMEKYVLYRYRMSDFGDNTPGSPLLEIGVDEKGVIIFFNQYKIDG